MSALPQVVLGSQGLAVPVQGLGCMGMTTLAGLDVYSKHDEAEGLVTIYLTASAS